MTHPIDFSAENDQRYTYEAKNLMEIVRNKTIVFFRLTFGIKKFLLKLKQTG